MSKATQMSLFLLTYILIYGAMNAYVIMRARIGLGLDTRQTVLAAGLGAFMVAGPVLVRMLERVGAEFFARLLAYLSYTWFGLVFLFISAGLALEIYRLVVMSFARGKWWLPDGAAMFHIPLLFCLALFVYGYFEGRSIKVERVNMTSAKMNPMRRKVRIAQVSDIHVGLMTGKKRIRRMVDILREENPDIIVSTGDLVDGTTSDSIALARIFSELKPRYGMFAVLGNHEYYAGIHRAIEFTEKAGFKLLRSMVVEIDTLPLSIAGADYPSRLTTGDAPAVAESELFDGLPEDNFNLLLKHVPYVDSARSMNPGGEGSVTTPDLQLSGHTHKGQIFPFNLVVRMFYPRIAGLYFLEGGSWMYVSRGTGVWGPPIRVFSRPEITIIEISPEIRD